MSEDAPPLSHYKCDQPDLDSNPSSTGLEYTLKLFKLLFSHLYKENSILYITDLGRGDEDMYIKASNAIGGTTWILKERQFTCLP